MANALFAMFRYGQTGSALDGFRDSEISKQSAFSLKNFYISEMGTLRVAKRFKETLLGTGTILNFRDTKYGFFIVFTSTYIHTINKTSKAIVASLAHGMNVTVNTNIQVFEDFISIVASATSRAVFGFNSAGLLATTNFWDTIQYPFRNLQEVSVDYYKVFEVTIGTEKQLRPELMAVYNGNLDLDISGGKIRLLNLGVTIDRVYPQFKASLTRDDISGIAVGQTYLVFRNYKATQGSHRYYLGNGAVTFTDPVTDSVYGSHYFTTASGTNASGKLVYGAKEDFSGSIVDVCEFQSRLVVATPAKVYFSKTLDYNDFTPGTDSGEGFFIKPTTIDNNQPNMLKLVSGTGLYLVLEKGIMVIGYGAHLTPSNSMSSVRIASNSEPTKQVALVENDFYYIDKGGKIRAVLLHAGDNTLQFANHIVEKYDYAKNQYNYLTKGVIDEDNTLLAGHVGAQTLYVYTKLEDGLFRNFSLDFPTSNPIFGYNNNILTGGSLYEPTEMNYALAEVVLNMPQLFTQNRGMYLNDFLTDYNRVVLNVYNMNKAIKGVSINDRPLQNLSVREGDFNIFDLNGRVNIRSPRISIHTKETSDTIELRGIDCFLDGR